ncbi:MULTISPECIES: orotidine-5'-phosphate decarboxylase [unclassified Iodidimonas]|jgi:orotidine-5'-phosphate decarboxylase|uniref:orotidine-5'-phosphate decarboxylase n=1 Tax=unclassified Iodidimonas TaxID=2626145 RepID=UPI002482EBAB|nr:MULTISPECIES: orotidine-5'-phosphate decarboxylase [unclassified Iodidimonas]
MQRFSNPLFCALDTGDLAQAIHLADSLKDVVGGFKLGLEFFCAHGPHGVEEIARRDIPLFIDLKFHDIPNTVAGAVRSVMRLNPAILTVHAAGGADMMRAAADAAADEASRLGVKVPWIVGVTVLTSLDAGDLDVLGIEGTTHKVVARLARLAEKSGLDGVVCAPHEISTTRSVAGRHLKLVVPGIRPRGSDSDDQKRVMTPKEAIENGATVIIVGRPITRASDPVGAARSIVNSISDL